MIVPRGHVILVEASVIAGATMRLWPRAALHANIQRPPQPSYTAGITGTQRGARCATPKAGAASQM